MPAALDFAVTSGLRTDMLATSAQDAATAPRSYEEFKRNHNDTNNLCQAEGINFLPVVAEAFGGGWGPTANKVWAELAKAKASITGELESTVATQLVQTLGLTLHRENARAILRRSAMPTTLDHHYHILGAATTLQSAAAEQRGDEYD